MLGIDGDFGNVRGDSGENRSDGPGKTEVTVQGDAGENRSGGLRRCLRDCREEMHEGFKVLAVF